VGNLQPFTNCARYFPAQENGRLAELSAPCSETHLKVISILYTLRSNLSQLILPRALQVINYQLPRGGHLRNNILCVHPLNEQNVKL
jgi:hypothetical protein